MSKFFKIEIVDYLPQRTVGEVIINIDDISYIENNTIRMKSLAVRKNDKWENVNRKTRTIKTDRFFEQEYFELTDKSLKELLNVLDYA